MYSTQTAHILEHMKNHRGISTMEAFDLYGVTRLSARIWDLRHDGYVIAGVRKDGVNRYGKKVSYYEYRLDGGAA